MKKTKKTNNQVNCVTRQERGWGAHYCLAHRCMFRRNTLLTYGDKHIVVSTVGCQRSIDNEQIEQVGPGRYYETLVFHSEPEEPYFDANVLREINVDMPRYISTEPNYYTSGQANDMHESVVAEVTKKLMERLL